MKFCRFCGKELQDNNICECEQSKQNRSTKRKKIIIAIVAAVAVFFLVAALLLASINRESQTDPGTNPNTTPSTNSNNNPPDDITKVNPFDYTEVSFDGFNSYGRVLINYDIDSMIEDLIGECPSEDDFAKFSSWLRQYVNYCENVEYSCSKNKELANGEVVTVTFSVGDSVSGEIKGGTKEYVVSGLKNTQEVDIFSNLSVAYSGLSGRAYATTKFSSSEEWAKYCAFETSSDYNLSNGDAIIVSLSARSMDTLKNTYGIIPKETSKTYIVEGLDAYVSSVDQVPTELLQQFADRFIAQVEEESVDEGGFSYGETTLYGIYFMTKKSGSLFTKNNVLEIIVATDEYYMGEYWRTVYEPLRFYNITVDPNGELDISYENGSHAIFTSDINSYLSDRKEDYNVFEIPIK